MASKTIDSVQVGTPGNPSTGGPSVVLGAAAEVDLLGDAKGGFNVELMDRFEFGFKNTGANSVTLKVYYQYVDGGLWFQDLGSGNAPTVTTGASARLQFINITARRIRVTATAAAGGSTGIIEAHGAGYQ